MASSGTARQMLLCSRNQRYLTCKATAVTLAGVVKQHWAATELSAMQAGAPCRKSPANKAHKDDEPPAHCQPGVAPEETSTCASQYATARSYAALSSGTPLPPSSRPSALRMAVAGVMGVS